MPQLVKGGKYVFGWTRIKNDRRIRIPDEAFDEYRLNKTDKIVLMDGSKTSGGFNINAPASIINSKPGQQVLALLGYNKESGSFTTRRLEMVRSGERWICWTMPDHEKKIRLSKKLMNTLGLNTGSRLLVVRGSGLGPAFINKGPLYNEAIKHKDLREY